MVLLTLKKNPLNRNGAEKNFNPAGLFALTRANKNIYLEQKEE